jgi:leucyl/phenylalanyl-tRNA---protein transferase
MSALNRELYNIFSNPRHKTVEDIVAVGGKLDSDILEFAYEHGVFPWPHEGYPLLWFSPAERGILEFSHLHVPKSFQKWLRKNENTYSIKLNQNFKQVMHECRRQKRKGQKGSWINDEIEKAYGELFAKSLAFSLEVYRKEKLVGGIYGVLSKNYVSCESMFHLEDQVSKLAFYRLVQHLKERKQTWMDIQMVTSVCESFGGSLISKEEFLKKIGF